MFNFHTGTWGCMLAQWWSCAAQPSRVQLIELAAFWPNLFRRCPSVSARLPPGYLAWWHGPYTWSACVTQQMKCSNYICFEYTTYKQGFSTTFQVGFQNHCKSEHVLWALHLTSKVPAGMYTSRAWHKIYPHNDWKVVHPHTCTYQKNLWPMFLFMSACFRRYLARALSWLCSNFNACSN